MLHSPDTLPLTDDELRHVQRLQVQLRAVRRCPNCQELAPIESFGSAGQCASCGQSSKLERWWAELKARRASGATSLQEVG